MTTRTRALHRGIDFDKAQRDAKAFVEELMASSPEDISVAPSEIPNLVQRLAGRPDATWFALCFYPPGAKLGADAVNLQYSVWNGEVGLDWVLLSQQNVEDKERVRAFAAQRGWIMRDHVLDGVEFLRVEGAGIERLGMAIIKDFYQVPDTLRLSIADSDHRERGAL